MKFSYKTIPAHEMTIKTGFLSNELTVEQWEKLIASYGDKWVGGSRHEYTVIVPDEEVLIAPTLSTVHGWLFGDWGPLYLTWKDSLLCPFDKRVKDMNITCSRGKRKQCGGLLVEYDHVRHLRGDMQRRCTGRVVCYKWCHVLSRVYWEIPIGELLELPDDSSAVASAILRRMYRESKFDDWYREKDRRGKWKKHEWLKCMEYDDPRG